MVFAIDMRLRNPTEHERVEIAGDERVLAIQRARNRLKN
jgi:hypothetical protein